MIYEVILLIMGNNNDVDMLINNYVIIVSRDAMILFIFTGFILQTYV